MPADVQRSDDNNAPRARSPEIDGSESARKRRRKVLSCYDCRRRKLSCDRVQPACGRCVRTGHAADCLYIDEADLPHRDQLATSSSKAASSLYQASQPSASVASSADTLARLDYQEHRIKDLETTLAQVNASSASLQRLKKSISSLSPESATGTAEVTAPIQEREAPLLRGRNFKTQFHGNTHPGAMVARVPELANFTRETFEQFPALLKIRNDMSALESRVQFAGSKHSSVSDADIKALLPPKADVDELLKIYFQNYGNMYQVLHLPSFWQEYEALWSELNNARPHFIALLLCLTASTQCLASTHPWLYVANSSVAREKAVTAIHAVDCWLASQSQKHVKAVDFQIRALLLFAKQVSARKHKRRWTETGSLLRYCMAAGLHRNPDLLRKQTSPLEKELRKRVWASVTEMDLQASFDRGMLSAPWILQSDCPAPSHILDEELSSTADVLPAPRRSSEFTSISFLAATAESMMLRTTINTTLNSIRQTLTFDDMKRYTDEIEAHLRSLPCWTEEGAAVVLSMLSLNLLQYLLALHGRQLRHTESKSERDYSCMVLIDTARRTIDIHQSLTSRGCYALEILRTDHLRAASSICYVSSISDPRADSVLSVVLDQAAARVIPDAIEMLTDRVYRFGCEQRQLWILCASNAYAKSKWDSTKRFHYMQEAVDKITQTYYRIMACQDGSASALAQPMLESSKSLQLLANDLSTSANAGSVSERQTSQAQLETLPTSDFNFEELAAWTFDDFFFDPVGIAPSSHFSQSQTHDMNSHRTGFH